MSTLRETERVFLVGVASEDLRKPEARELLDELHGLAQTLGLEQSENSYTAAGYEPSPPFGTRKGGRIG